MDNFELHGPIDVVLRVHVTNGKQGAAVTFDMARGTLPTVKTMQDAIQKALEGAQKQLGDDWRLLTKREMFDTIVTDKTGSNERFAMPGKKDWDAPPTA